MLGERHGPRRAQLEARSSQDPGPSWNAGREIVGRWLVAWARIVLLASQGLPGPEIAERVGCTEPTVVITLVTLSSA
ncbi:MAG: hypothetical protein M3Z25_13065 [Actinomycetota bacterium]|nr:hypothetical protein [Actinomycetota bacterium]